MKKLLLLLLCVPLMFSCGEIENSLTRANIKGKVKEIIETTFYAKEAFDEPQKGDLRQKKIIKYDEDGNITELTAYLADWEIDFKFKHQYDEDGNMTEETSCYADGELDSKTKYQYDEDGNMIGKSYAGWLFNDDDRTYQYEYDKLKNWIVRTEYIDDILEFIIEREIEYYE